MANSIIQHRRGTTADWEAYKDWFILEEGEIGVEFRTEDTILKVGDGKTVYKDLKGISASAENLDAIIDAQKVLSNKVDELQSNIENVLFVDGLEYVDNKLYLTSNGEVISDGVEISGGPGGPGGSFIEFYVETNSDPLLTVGKNQACNLPIKCVSKRYEGPYTGNYRCAIYVGDMTTPKTTLSCEQLGPDGLPKFNDIDVAPYLLTGENKVVLTCTDKYSNSESLEWLITVVSLKLNSAFDDSTPIIFDGSEEKLQRQFNFTLTGGTDINKTLYLIIDNKDIQTYPVDPSTTYYIDLTNYRSHGVHTLEVYVAATVNGVPIKSNSYMYNLILAHQDSKVPIIASYYDVKEVSQGDLLSIPYIVYDSVNSTPTVKLTVLHKVSGVWTEYAIPDERTVNYSRQTWDIRDYPVGEEVKFRISYNNVTTNQYKEVIHTIKVTESKFASKPIAGNLELSLSSAGHSNTDQNPAQWLYNNTNMASFSNFNWTTNGWIKDTPGEEPGDICLRVSGKAKATINFKPFKNDFTTNGKTIELEFAVRDVNNRGAVPIRCFKFPDRSETLHELQTSLLYAPVLPGTLKASGESTEHITDTHTKYAHIVSGSVTCVEGDTEDTLIEDYITGALTDAAMGKTITYNYYYDEADILADNSGALDYANGTLKEGLTDLTVTYQTDIGNKWVGFKVTPDTTTFHSTQSEVTCSYKEDQKVKISICVQPKNGYDKFISMYLDGVLCGTTQYVDTDVFSQKSTELSDIEIGSEDCSVDIYNIQVYNTCLTAKQVLQNYIAGTADLMDKANIYDENDIYDLETQELSYRKVKQKIPTVTFIGDMPKVKGDKKKKSVRMIFEHPTKPELNFDEILDQIDVQGTSSAGYVRKNWKTKHKENLLHMEDQLPAKVFCLKVDYAECTGTHNTQNANLVEEFYSKPIPVKNPANYPEGLSEEAIEDTEKIRTTIAGYPIVIFHLNTTDKHLINNITKAELEQRSDVMFSSKGNFNYDKGAEHVFGFTDDFDVECWEFCETENPTCFLSEFPEDTHPKYWEARYHPELDILEDLIDTYGEKDANGNIPAQVKAQQDKMINARFKPMYNWVYSTATGTYFNGTENVPYATGERLAADYTGVDGTVYKQDTDAYRLAKFRKEFTNWFDLHYTTIYYVYTFFALMTDQRAKNLFLTYWPDNPYDKDCTTGKWYPYFYDNDTCFGINNTGNLVFDYYNEDSDTYGSSGYVFNGRNSVLWCNFKEAFPNEIRKMYKDLRADKKITYSKFVEQFITKGSDQWSASIYNEDANYKYIKLATPASDWYPIEDDEVAKTPKITSEFLPQVRGNGEQHLKYFLQNRIKYCDSKWQCGDYNNNIVTLRVFTPRQLDVLTYPTKDDFPVTPDADKLYHIYEATDEAKLYEWDSKDLEYKVSGYDHTSIMKLNASLAAIPPNPNITLVPYSNMYCGVTYGADSGEGDGTSRMIHKRAYQDTPISFSPGRDDAYMNEKETYIHGASELSSIGDLAPLYCGKVDVAAASKLIDLKIGDSNPNYFNNNLSAVSVGANNLLKSIDISNCVKLSGVLDVSECLNIESIKAKGTKITSVKLPAAGYVKELLLPNTITTLEIKNQMFLQDIDLDSTEISSLHIENCPELDATAFLRRFEQRDFSQNLLGFNIDYLCLTGINWTGDNKVTYDYMEKLSRVSSLKYPSESRSADLSGIVEISDDMTNEKMTNLQRWFPELKIIFHNLSYTVTYMDASGTTELYRYTNTIDTWNTNNAYDILDPLNPPPDLEINIDSQYLIPPESIQWLYTLDRAGHHWRFAYDEEPNPGALRNIFQDTTLYLAFNRTVRTYDIHFYNDNILLGTVAIQYGSIVVLDSQELLEKQNTRIPHKFSHWALTDLSECTTVTGPMTVYAQFDIDYSKFTTLDATNTDIQYTLNSTDMTARIISYRGQEPFIKVPEILEVDNATYTVTSVSNLGHTSLIYIELPETLKTIESNTFIGSILLESIDIPDSVDTIGVSAFEKCTNLKSIKLPLDNSNFVKLSDHLLMDCISLSEIIIPDTVNRIGTMSIYNCSKLSNIVLPDSITTIDMYAFKSCDILEEVTFRGIPSTVNSQAFHELPVNASKIVFNVPWVSSEYHGEPWGASSGKYIVNYNT